MIERIHQFLPALTTLLTLVLGGGLCDYLLKWRLREKLNSLAWIKEHKWRLVFFVGTPGAILLVPALEELIFRAPIILAYPALTPDAWQDILLMSLAFALTHAFGPPVTLDMLLAEDHAGQVLTDDRELEQARYRELHRTRMITSALLQTTFTFFIGAWFGYEGIKHQSLWLCFFLHGAWNLIMPAAVPIMMLLVLVLFSLAMRAFDGLWHWPAKLIRRASRRRFRSPTQLL